MPKKAADKNAKRQQIKMPEKAADKNARKGMQIKSFKYKIIYPPVFCNRLK